MAPASSQDDDAVLDPLRQRLVRVADRMLGTVADAEDVVPARLKSVRHRRETNMRTRPGLGENHPTNSRTARAA
jgi:DNA-directed RNA polymerase specialized sigma24 family protein